MATSISVVNVTTENKKMIMIKLLAASTFRIVDRTAITFNCAATVKSRPSEF